MSTLTPSLDAVTQPLFLEIGFPGPHPPYDPIPRYTERYLAQKNLNILPVTQQELDSQPQPFKGMRVHNTEVDHDSVHYLLEPTAEQRHRQRAFYLANVTMIDEKIGEILSTLEESGYSDNSIVIFTSDHGDMMGERGLHYKKTFFEWSARVPLIFWAGDRLNPHRVIETVSLLDILPTFADLAGTWNDVIEADGTEGYVPVVWLGLHSSSLSAPLSSRERARAWRGGVGARGPLGLRATAGELGARS